MGHVRSLARSCTLGNATEMTQPVTPFDETDEAIEDAAMAAANAQIDAGQGIPQAVMGAWLQSLAQGEHAASMFAADPGDYDTWFSGQGPRGD